MKKYILIAVALWAAAACHRGPRAIPEQEMRAIIRETLIGQSIIQQDRDERRFRPLDSLDMYSEVLGQYGYTLEDFRFTVREMAMRKSNPLTNILGEVAADIKAISVVAEARYKHQLHLDSIAQQMTSDTVFRSDTVLRGKLDGYRFVYAQRSEKGDSVVPRGLYRLSFRYSTGSHARSYTKSVRARRVSRDGDAAENTFWLPVAKDTVPYEGEIRVATGVERLTVSISETLRKDQRPDTCYLTGVRLTYVLPVVQARAAWLERLTGFPSDLEEYYEKQYLDSLAKRSGSVPPRL
ncbi:hypothetical protein [uncultured Rikenella sp.]|uniref:hypothetical protein n=1 Tax=uncultured Rikenella sp. TaxID=368003 RepID=UPI0025E30E85|nr:hypothetical protein [uncultured Rikenella sp.]